MIFTNTQGHLINKRPVDSNIQLIRSRIPIAKYYRKTLDCDCSGNITEVFKNVDCCKSDKQKIKYLANTNLDKDYYTTMKQYLQSKNQTYLQNLQEYDDPSCCKISYYKKNNEPFGVQGAVQSSTRLLRLKYNTIITNNKYNPNRVLYRGEQTQNNYLTQERAVCLRRNGDKLKCN
jgi:hypothetical protein